MSRPADSCRAPFDVALLNSVRAWTSREWAVGESDGWPEGLG
jgi:hypothetical protein